MESRVLLSGTTSIYSGYIVNTLGYFGANGNGGAPRSTLVADAKGNLYGTTSAGGNYGAGTVFEIPTGSTTPTTLVSFNGVHGTAPYAGVTLDSAGDLFGTTYQGGAFDFGTVFEIAAGPVPVVTTLASFTGPNGPDGKPYDPTTGIGEHPVAGVTMNAAGDLFGTTADGGTNSGGTVWKIAHGTTALATLVSFTGTPDGFRPYGNLLLDGSGNLFGTTQYGGKAADGTINDGTIFEIPAGTTKATTLASFSGPDGIRPYGGLASDAGGNLFGTTYYGGGNNAGTIFELPSGSSQITSVASFEVNANNANPGNPAPADDGAHPYATLTFDASGNLYGTTIGGGDNADGTIFKVAPNSNLITTVVSFNSVNGATPYGGVFVDAKGNVLGTTAAGGDNGAGTVYEIPTGSTTLTTLVSFDGVGTSLYPFSESVIVDSSGNVFGMTPNGGLFHQGSVYEIAAGTTTFTTLASFNGTNGSQPDGALAIDAKGNLFGTASSGGANGYGTVFEVASGFNAVTVLASFDSTNTGADPGAGVVLDSNGNLFGTTPNGGANNNGTVFEVAQGSKAITALASFNPSLNGFSPYTPVTLDASTGTLFGTAQGLDNSGVPGGANNSGGIVYKVVPGTNAITTLGSFSYDQGKYLNGEYPDGGVIVDSAGNLYGTANQGGANGTGTLFKLPAGSNVITALTSFSAETSNGNDTGANPYGNLVMDSAGNLFGTAYQGGAHDNGTIYEFLSGGTLTTIASFDGRDGEYPFVGMVMDSKGNFYGTTEEGGVIGAGTVFELSKQTVVTIAPDGAPNPAPGDQPLGYTVSVADEVPDGETVTIEDTSNGNVVVATGTLSSDTAVLTIPAGTLAPGTHNLVAVYAGDASFPPGQSLPYAQIIGAGAAPPTLVGSPVINGDNPNGLFNAPGQATPGQQRSMVEDVVYTFNEPVTIANANQAFKVVAAGPHAGTAPTALYAQAVAGSNGTQWAVSLTGQPIGTLASIANGEYSITINPAYVFAAADGVTTMAPGTGRTDSFYRLYGDVFGTENLTALDYSRFKQSFSTYNPIFDNYNTGNTTALDYALFKKDLSIDYSSDGFVTTI